MKLVRLITVCVNEIHGKAWIEKHLSRIYCSE